VRLTCISLVERGVSASSRYLNRTREIAYSPHRYPRASMIGRCWHARTTYVRAWPRFRAPSLESRGHVVPLHLRSIYSGVVDGSRLNQNHPDIADVLQTEHGRGSAIDFSSYFVLMYLRSLAPMLDQALPSRAVQAKSHDEFRRRADECRRLAAAARNARDKAFWLGLVERWQALEGQRSVRPSAPPASPAAERKPWGEDRGTPAATRARLNRQRGPPPVDCSRRANRRRKA